MLFMVLTIVICVITARTEVKREPFLGGELLKGGHEKISSWTKSARETYYNKLIEEYAQCLREAELAIKRTARLYNMAILSFIVGLAYMAIALAAL